MNLKDYCSFLKEAGVADPRRYLATELDDYLLHLRTSFHLTRELPDIGQPFPGTPNL